MLERFLGIVLISLFRLLGRSNRADVGFVCFAIYECYEFYINLLKLAVSRTTVGFKAIVSGEALPRFIRILDTQINRCLLRSWKLPYL
jgi:hypothetical protein